MNEIQFQKPHSNTFAFVKMSGDSGKLVFEVNMFNWNSETEENEPIAEGLIFSIEEFAYWLKSGKWIVC